MGTRRDDITSDQRAQIAIAMLASDRLHGTASQLAGNYAVSRQSVYNIAAKGQEVLRQGLQPGPHGPHWAEKTITVNANRLRNQRVKMIVLPLRDRQGGASPCRFIAVEDR